MSCGHKTPSKIFARVIVDAARELKLDFTESATFTNSSLTRSSKTTVTR